MSSEAIQTMLGKYKIVRKEEGIRALREIVQEIALAGLWRAKFFEHAAFYGGTSLRILYHLNRFSEDLDFSLLKPDPNFSLDPYNEAIKRELNSFGFEVNVQTKIKSIDTKIESAFIKANTKREMLTIGIPSELAKSIHHDQKISVKLEVDTDPPQGFSVEEKQLFLPAVFSVKSYVRSDLFSGKMHAVLCRQWKRRVKGRDWYDFAWFTQRDIPLNLSYLQSRMHQSGYLQETEPLTSGLLLERLHEKIDSLNVSSALDDIRQFVEDEAGLSLWSKDYFHECADRIKFH